MKFALVAVLLGAVTGAQNGRARLRGVQIGHRNQTKAEVIGGIGPGEQVILHPANELAEGVRVRTQ